MKSVMESGSNQFPCCPLQAQVWEGHALVCRVFLQCKQKTRIWAVDFNIFITIWLGHLSKVFPFFFSILWIQPHKQRQFRCPSDGDIGSSDRIYFCRKSSSSCTEGEFPLIADNMSCLPISCCYRGTSLPYFNKVFCSINEIWHIISLLYVPEKTLLTQCTVKERGVSQSCATEVSLCHQNSTYLVSNSCCLLEISLAVRPLLRQRAAYLSLCINDFTTLEDHLEK